VISATQAPWRVSPSWRTAGRQAVSGRSRIALADRRGEIEAHQEVDPCGAQLVGQLVGGGGAVGPDHDHRVLDHRARELLERQADDVDVVGRGVGAGVARAQHAGQRLAGLIQIGQQRVKPEAALERARRAVLVGVRRDQRRVDVDDDPLGPSAGVPRVLARPRASGPQRVEQAPVAGDPIDDPKRRSVRRDLAEQRLLVADRAQIRKAVAPIGEHHRQVAHHPAGIVPAPPLAHPDKAPRQRPCQAQPVGRLGQQRRARVRDQTLSVRPDFYGETAAIALHPQGDPPERRGLGFDNHRIPAHSNSSAPPTTGGATASRTIRASGPSREVEPLQASTPTWAGAYVHFNGNSPKRPPRD
jgi:hypothetical protein